MTASILGGMPSRCRSPGTLLSTRSLIISTLSMCKVTTQYLEQETGPATIFGGENEVMARLKFNFRTKPRHVDEANLITEQSKAVDAQEERS